MLNGCGLIKFPFLAELKYGSKLFSEIKFNALGQVVEEQTESSGGI